MRTVAFGLLIVGLVVAGCGGEAARELAKGKSPSKPLFSVWTSNSTDKTLDLTAGKFSSASAGSPGAIEHRWFSVEFESVNGVKCFAAAMLSGDETSGLGNIEFSPLSAAGCPVSGAIAFRYDNLNATLTFYTMPISAGTVIDSYK